MTKNSVGRPKKDQKKIYAQINIPIFLKNQIEIIKKEYNFKNYDECISAILSAFKQAQDKKLDNIIK